MERKEFGRWTVIGEPITIDKRQGYKVLCKCVCGTKRYVRVLCLKNGRSQSCGCRIKDHHNEVMGKWFSGSEERREQFK